MAARICPPHSAADRDTQGQGGRHSGRHGLWWGRETLNRSHSWDTVCQPLSVSVAWTCPQRHPGGQAPPQGNESGEGRTGCTALEFPQPSARRLSETVFSA